MAPLQPDPYNILGVPTDADTSEIRSSYRKLVLRCHPDKVQDPKLKAEKQNEFQRVQQAYELLTDDDERRKYDMKVKLEALRCQMKEREKARKASPKPSAKFSGEFEIRTPEMRPSGFKSPPPATKVYTSGVRYDDEYATRTRIFETKSSRSSKRDPSVSERYSKREAAEREREREKDSQRDRERRRKEEEVSRRKAEKEAQKLDKKRQDKIRDRDLKRDAEEKYRARYAKPAVEVYEEEVLKSERKRSSKKHDEKGGRTSPPEKPIPSSRPPLSSRSFYTPTDRNKFENASSYVQASRGAPGLSRSYSYSSPPVYPAAPSPPPTNPKKAFMVEESDSDDYVRRSSAPSRRGSGDAPRLSRERSAYRKSSNEVLDDSLHASPSPAARASFSRSTPMAMGSTPPRHEMPLPRVNSLPQQPGFSRPSPGMTRAHTFAAPEMPRGRDRSRTQPQAHVESSDEEHEHDRRYRSRRTASPEPQRDVWCYNVDPETRRTRRMPQDIDSGHAHYMHAHPVRVVESRVPPVYREGSYPGPPQGRYPNVATSKYGEVRYSDYPPYSTPVRA